MYPKPFVNKATVPPSTKWEVYFESACGQIIEADLLRQEVPLERALFALAMIAFNTRGLENHHGDIVHLDGTIEPPSWGAPILPTWTVKKNEAKHLGSILIAYGEEGECGLLEVWKRPSR